MGSRSNLAVDFGNDEAGKPQRVYLYSHWDGEDIAVHLRDAAKEGRRLDDPQYFARILFDKMVGKRQGEETGYGISPVVCDNSYRILVADCDSGVIFAEDDPTCRWTFAEFAALTNEAATAAMERA